MVPQLHEIEQVLKEINTVHQLGIYLEIPTENLERFEREYPHDIARQRAEVITHWLRNCIYPTWDGLTAAVEKLGRYSNLVKRLRECAQKSSQDDIVAGMTCGCG